MIRCCTLLIVTNVVAPQRILKYTLWSSTDLNYPFFVSGCGCKLVIEPFERFYWERLYSSRIGTIGVLVVVRMCFLAVYVVVYFFSFTSTSSKSNYWLFPIFMVNMSVRCLLLKWNHKLFISLFPCLEITSHLCISVRVLSMHILLIVPWNTQWIGRPESVIEVNPLVVLLLVCTVVLCIVCTCLLHDL